MYVHYIDRALTAAGSSSWAVCLRQIAIAAGFEDIPQIVQNDLRCAEYAARAALAAGGNKPNQRIMLLLHTAKFNSSRGIPHPPMRWGGIATGRKP